MAIKKSNRKQKILTFQYLSLKVNMDIRQYSYKQDYTKKKTLGCGAYGKVYKVAHKHTGTSYAIKVFLDDGSVLEEINALLMLEHHKNILYPVCIYTYKKTAIVLPYVKQNLYRWYKLCRYDRRTIKLIMFQLLEALHHVHNLGIIHRDVKPANVMISSDSQPKIYLIDFGMCKIINPHRGEMAMDHCVQTSSYRSPELYAGHNTYGTEIDVWALGCLMVELFLRSVLFGVCDTQIITNQWKLATPPLDNYPEYTSYPMFSKIRYLVRDGITNHTSLDEMIKCHMLGKMKIKISDMVFISTMLNIHPGSRPSAAQLLQSPYFASITNRITHKQKIVWMLSGQTYVKPYHDDRALHSIYDHIITDWLCYNRANKDWISLCVALDMFNRVARYYHVDRVKCPYVILEMMSSVCLHIAQMICTEKKLLDLNMDQYDIVSREVAIACDYRVIVPTSGHFLQYITHGNCSDAAYATCVLQYLTGPHDFSTMDFIKSLVSTRGLKSMRESAEAKILERYKSMGWWRYRSLRYLYHTSYLYNKVQ
jgi:serine/threonine protein kinase